MIKQVIIKSMLKTNSYKQTDFTPQFPPSSKIIYSPSNKPHPTTVQNDKHSLPHPIQPQLQSEELFFQASLQWVKKKKIAHYFLFTDELIGQGSFAKVYKGMNIHTSQTVAIKVMEMKHIVQKKLYALLQAEIQTFKSLKHPNVLRCYEILITDNNCYIVTELCKDGELKQFIEKKLKIKQKEEDMKTLVEPLIYDIYQGLLYLERKGIVHRDIKMANILVKDGKAKIADFGFASFSKYVFQQLLRSSFVDVMVGSPIYMAPQSFLSNVYSSKSDVWAFGILLYELFHGNSPFEHCKNDQQLQKQIRIPFDKDKIKVSVCVQLSQLICECLTYDHHMRPSFKQLWKNPYMKNHRFKSYVESRNLVNYKETSAKKIKDSQSFKEESDMAVNQSFNFNNDSRIQNDNFESNDQNQEGCSFEDFLKISSNEITDFSIPSDFDSQKLSLKKIKSQHIIQEQKGSPNKSFEDQMQEFYRQAQNMMKAEQSSWQTTQQSPKVNSRKSQAKIQDKLKPQQVLNEKPKYQTPKKQNISNANLDKKAAKPQEISKMAAQIKSQVIEQAKQLNSQFQKSQTQNSSPKRSQKINLNKNFCLDSSPSQPFLNRKKEQLNEQQLPSPLKTQNNEEKGIQSFDSLQIQQSPIVSTLQANEVPLQLTVNKQEKSELKPKSPVSKKPQQKTHNQNLQKFWNMLKKQQQESKAKTKQKQKKITKTNKETEQIDQIFVLLEFSRFIIKFLKFADDLTNSFESQTKMERSFTKIHTPQSAAVQSVIELYTMIFTSYTLNREIFLQEELFTMCQTVIMKRVSQISLNIDSGQNRDLFEIIKTHKNMLRSFKEEKQSLKPNIDCQKHKPQHLLGQIYKGIKILEEPVTKLGEISGSICDKSVQIMGRKLCWMGLWLSKIYDILIEVQEILRPKSKTTNMNGHQIPIKLIKQMQNFVDNYESGQVNLTVGFQQSSSVENDQKKVQKDLLKQDINYFFQLVYEIQLKRMNIQLQ